MSVVNLSIVEMERVLYYAGKQLDMFEGVFRQLLEYNGVMQADYLDCIGRRNFGFSVDVLEQAWFCPYISCEEAVEYIASKLGIKLRCGGTELLERLLEEMDYCRNGMIIGPMKKGVAAAGLREYYYDGKGIYLFVEAIENGKFKVYDPQGMPGLTVSREEIRILAAESKPFAIIYEGSGTDERESSRQLDAANIFRKGMEYHKRIQKAELQEIQNAGKYYQKGSANQIGLQYGIINLCLQLDKVAMLAEECGHLSDQAEREYYICKRKLYDVGQKEEVERIPEIWEKIWEVLG